MMDKIYVRKENSKRVDYTVRFLFFNPKSPHSYTHFISTHEAKDLCRKDMRCSKKKMNDEYDSMYGYWMKVGRGKDRHIEFNLTTKEGANVIFILPKSKKSHFRKILVNIEVPC